MRKPIFAFAALAALVAAPAIAADAPLPYRSPATYTSVSNWTGPYAGFSIGYLSGTVVETPEAVAPDIFLDRLNPKGFVGGVQLGYNVRLGRSGMAGLETDFQLASITGSRSIDWCPGCTAYGISVTETQRVKVPWFGTTRLRVGFLPWDKLLVYATGGVAYGKVNATSTTDVAYNFDWFSYQYQSRATTSRFAVGWTAGVGAEWAFAQNWRAKAEYLYMDLGVTEARYADTFGYAYASSVRAQNHLLRFGVNYAF